MSNQLVPAGANNPGGALAVVNPRGIVAPTTDMLGNGGGGFAEVWVINKDKHVFHNKKTGEERAELYVIVEEMHPQRALFPKQGAQQGERVCWSEDGKVSYNSIECASCPRVSEDDAFNKWYEAHPNVQRPQYMGDCSLRYSIYWSKEFVVGADGAITLRLIKDRILVNVPKSSIFALWSERNGYIKKLRDQGLDITQVVTKIKLVQRENTKLKTMYDYAEFDSLGKIEEVMPRVSKTVEIVSEPQAQAPAGASYPGGVPAGLPQMAGSPAAAPAATGFPAAASGFPAAVATGGFPTAPVAPAATGFPAAAATTPATPGFPGAAPASAPGFPPAAAPATASAAVAPGFPGVAQPTVAAAAAPVSAAPSFQDMARQKLIQDFNALGNEVKPVVLSVLGVQKIEDVTNEKLIQATQAVNSAKGFSAPVAAGAGAQGGNPF